MVFRRLITTASCLCVLLAGLAGNAMATDLKIGGIGLVKPNYEGSDAYESRRRPVRYPVFSSTSDNTFTINGADDVRWRSSTTRV